MKRARLITLIPACLICLSAFAQKALPENNRPIVLNHIAMYVHDLQKSTAFYENVLGLEKIPEPFHDGLHTWFTMGTAGQLHLIQGAKESVQRNKNDHLCFSVASVDAFIDKLSKHQIAYSDWPGTPSKIQIRVDGVKQIYFQDPDGHWIEINDDKR